ncbi:OLC1v1017957C1 [Oldenlandia corymbosa var. corymbosa]|uniref:OLC1v1017957C1 n=1 Tax=Oldenlandia corymbosa var. corymbosa TaxID=529605 RepID=A0AAV1EAI2_OLDCO|nr:OLC1v1017957C1 [Oldenlandia corymbosa var. corymbosa]
MDGHVSESPIPLSPQWLLPKSGEIKSGLTGENHISLHPGFSSRSDIMKSPGLNEEARDSNKKRDVFRPSVLDMDSGRRERWRDEERETNSAVRKDRWREGDKEPTENRRTDRWTDSSGKYYGEARRGQNDRWTDSGNKETSNEPRRENKWNSRWGPDDKESDNLREKWADSSKDPDLEKSASHVSYHGRDEKEGDHYRPWRLNSSQSRGRADPPPHYTPPTPNRQAPVFTHGRGRGETTPTFSLGRGRVNPASNAYTQLHSVGSLSEKGETLNGESLPWRYSRTKLLDLYRTTDTRLSDKLLTELTQVPSLTQEDALEPLALCSPTSEELMILKGIDKGDVVGSGAPQVTRDGSMGRNSSDFLQSRRNKLGPGDDLPLDANDPKDKALETAGGGSNYTEHLSYDPRVQSHGFPSKHDPGQEHNKYPDHRLSSEAARDDGTYRKHNNVPVNAEETMHGHSSIGGPWRSSSFGERLHSVVQDSRELPGPVSSRAPDVGWSDPQKDMNTEWGKRVADQSYARSDGPNWRIGEEHVLRRQPSAIFEKEPDIQKAIPQSPEDLVLYYKDPQGAIQGPFRGSDIIGWFEAGYFGIDLLVRLAGSPPDSPFCLLGDVMPHLRAKVRPPPGFSAAKQNEIADASSRFNFSSFGVPRADPSEIDMMQNESRYKHNSATEAENRFLESLMNGNMSGFPLEKSIPSEGIRGYLGSNTNTTLGAESADNAYLLAKKVSLERQRSLPNPYPWPVRETVPHFPASEIAQDSTLPHSRLLPSLADNARPQLAPQNVDLMSILQGLPERSNVGLNNGPTGWSNFSAQAGLDPLQEKLDIHQAQNFPPHAAYGMQQQRLQPQANLLGNVMDNTSGIFGPDKLISPALSQDPQLLNLLQQRQLQQSQTPASLQQLNLLDRMLLLKHQQKQEEQQLLLRQQKELLSQVLSEQNPHQRLGETPYGQLQTAPAAMAPSDHSQFQPSHELFKVGSQLQVPNLQEERASSFGQTPSVTRDMIQSVGAETSRMPLPHEVFGEAVHHSGWDHNLSEHFGRPEQKTSSSMNDLLSPLGLLKNYQPEMSLQTNNPELTFNAALSSPTGEHLELSMTMPPVATGSDAKVLSVPEQVEESRLLSDGTQAEAIQSTNESIVAKEVKNVESREIKKSDKKSKKQKSAKASADKGTKMQDLKPADIEGTNFSVEKLDRQSLPEEQKALSPPTSQVDGLTLDEKNQLGQVGSNTLPNNIQVPAGRAWKPAPGFKPKSLLEIQLEEQSRAQKEIAVPEPVTSLSSSNILTPWAGVVANVDSKSLRETSDLNPGKLDSSVNQRSRKSQLHDLLQDTAVAKSSEKETENDGFSYASVASSQPEAIEDNNFIEAKDTKKSRKKSAKSKNAGSKASIMSIPDVPVGSSPLDKNKSLRTLQQDKEVLPAIPSGPSLGDFVVWKGDTVNSAPPPAWSTDSGKVPKPTSLRDILKEQGKKSTSQHIPVPSAQKPAATQPSRGGGSSWSTSGASPGKAASPIQINSQVSLSKHKADDDLFWGPADQPKQETKLSDFPQLGSKSTTSKAVPSVALSRQKSSSGKPMEHSSASNLSTNLSIKGKKDSSTKYTEAMDFREWCENECIRLIKTKDTSFLEYCLKQSRQEAETLLIENLGSFDPDHEFIDKFLNYKDLLPADVLEIAFQSRNDRRVAGSGAREVISDNGGFRDSDQSSATAGEGSAKGKKKAKKGKKVSPSVLGFNVVSNRIMMGEIQTVED